MLAGTVTNTVSEAAGGGVTEDAMRKLSASGPATRRGVSSVQAARMSRGQSNRRNDGSFDEMWWSILSSGRRALKTLPQQARPTIDSSDYGLSITVIARPLNRSTAQSLFRSSSLSLYRSMPNRRDFVRSSAAAAALLGTRAALAQPPAILPPPTSDPYVDDLAMEALNAAKAAGASYADVRIGRYRRQSINTREHQVTGVSDGESYGIGIRTLVGGAWGFAATATMTPAGVQQVAQEAARLSRAAKSVPRRPIELAPVQVVKGTWRTPITRDPLEVPIEEKVALLLAANEAALKVPKVRFATSGLQLLREEKTLATTDGTLVTQTFIRVGPSFTATAIAEGDFQSYNEELAPRGSGWEYVQSLNMPGNAERWASLAAEKLTARSVDVGRYDLILDPTNLWLTIHESIGHPTELDRAMGYEANYAGTSFVAPPEKMLGQLKYGPPIMNIQGDRSQPGGCATIGWDDDGVQPESFLIIKNGIFNDYQTSREQAPWLEEYYKKNNRPVR